MGGSLVEAPRPPHGQQRLPASEGRRRQGIAGYVAAKAARNKVLQPVCHAFPLPGAEPYPALQGDPGPAAESQVFPAVFHEAAHGIQPLGGKRPDLAPCGSAGHKEQLARNPGLGYF